LLSLGDLRAPFFSLSVARDDVGLEDEFELVMQLSVAPFGAMGNGNEQNQGRILQISCDSWSILIQTGSVGSGHGHQ
jgi:hypothetical protein